MWLSDGERDKEKIQDFLNIWSKLGSEINKLVKTMQILTTASITSKDPFQNAPLVDSSKKHYCSLIMA